MASAACRNSKVSWGQVSGATSNSAGAGVRIRYVVLDNEVHILPVRPLKSLCGALRHDDPPVPLEDRERAIAEGARDL